MVDIEVGQRWTHKMTSMAFSVALVDGDEILLEPEGDGAELTLSRNMLIQEFKCPLFRRCQSRGKQKRIKPGKIRRGARR
ncbi:MAG TPA: hypothetical protein DCE42_20755 [Myxococcales bacterium]|nr:hypothetical protein [Myxococcales bacterium]